MRLLQHLNPFHIYNILLIFIFSVTVNGYNFFSNINLIFYCIFHFLIIYISIYYYRKLLYVVYSLYGLGLDLFWLHEIGPHILTFISVLFFFNLLSKYLYNLNSYKIYILLLIIQIIMVTFEMIISEILFSFGFDINYYFQIIILSLFISYPVFFLFSKIDRFK